MLVSRRYLDAVAAAATGGGVVLIAAGLKPVPEVIGYLGPVAYLWALLMLVSSLAATVGSMLRTRDPHKLKRADWSVLLEKAGWPLIAGCALVFCLGVVSTYGVSAAALTLGWSVSTIAFCLGHWRDLRPPKGIERHAEL